MQSDSIYSNSILSVPIQNNLKRVIGVAQLVKTQKETFTELDIGTLEVLPCTGAVARWLLPMLPCRDFPYSLASAFTTA